MKYLKMNYCFYLLASKQLTCIIFVSFWNLTKQVTLVTIVRFADKLYVLIVVGAIVGILVNTVDSIEETELSVWVEVRITVSVELAKVEEGFDASIIQNIFNIGLINFFIK